MSAFKPDVFFDLSRFKHAALFNGVGHVWEVLPLISTYLKEAKLGAIECQVPQGAYIVNPESVSIGKGTIIEPGAYIKGPCIIGENCTVRHGAYIRGDLIAGNGCVIGHATEVKNAIFLDGAHAAHFAYVGDSILGNKVNLGAGTKCANLKFDSSPIVIAFDGQLFKTDLRKFGAIIGDDSQLGCNSVLNPGTLVGKGVWCFPCVNFSGIIPAGHIVKNNGTPRVFPGK